MSHPSHLSIDGKSYNLIWGHKHMVVSDGTSIRAKIDNSQLSRMLGSMKLPDLVRREMARQG